MAAALVNGSAAHPNDFDDTSYTGIMHGSAVDFPAALAMTEQHGANGKLLIVAFIAGVEIEYAIAEYCTTKNYFKGWWTSSIYGALGTAAASAKILDLNLNQTAHALAIATSASSGMAASNGIGGACENRASRLNPTLYVQLLKRGPNWHCNSLQSMEYKLEISKASIAKCPIWYSLV